MPRFANGRFLVPVLNVVGVATLALSLTFVVVMGRRDTEAHKAVTSPYMFNRDVFPILRDKCGRCHIQGGAAPMALLIWNDGPDSATPWAEGIRELLISEQMPPWYVDPTGPGVKGGITLTPAETDRLITWATGGTPEGDPNKRPAALSYQNRWIAGPPDLKIQMDADYTMPAGTTDETKEFVLSTGLSDVRWVKAVDLLPGAPSIVRNAVISVENGPTLAVWVPADDAIAAPSGSAFRVPAGAKLKLQIHYKKQWQNEGKTIADRSTVGLYFTDAPASGRDIQGLVIDGPAGEAADGKTFAQTLAGGARILAVRPSFDHVYGSVTVQAVTPAGTRVPLLTLRVPRPEWRRRYWLADPVELPAGSKIEVSTTPPPSYIDLTGTRLMKSFPLQVALDFVPLQ